MTATLKCVAIVVVLIVGLASASCDRPMAPTNEPVKEDALSTEELVGQLQTAEDPNARLHAARKLAELPRKELKNIASDLKKALAKETYQGAKFEIQKALKKAK